ncbi:MAG: sulfatase-like hydrolase/transferase [Panacibacter sp.]
MKKHKLNTPVLLQPILILQPSFYLLLVVGVLLLGSCKKDFNEASTASASSEIGGEHAAATQPNILLILADDLGYEVPTADGGQSYSTPNIDKLAKRGMLFTQGHATPLCSPSRVMLLTGKYSFRNYAIWGKLDLSQKTLGNMFKDAGYATCYTGKWQNDGGDNAIRTFGFDKYSVYLPFLLDNEFLEGSRYKGCKIYQDGGYLPTSLTADKYADDEFTSYLINFIDSSANVGKPFFAYYAMNLVHPPLSPTPDDPEYATWDFDVRGNGDKKFFPSMVKYADKKVGELVEHLSAIGALNNTLIIFTGDNGTPRTVTSQFNGFAVRGGKHNTTEPGTNVPLIAYWPKTIAKGMVKNDLIDFTDFLPTLADVAGIPKPITYGTLDGVSFYPTLITGSNPNMRSTIYDAFSGDITKRPFNRWTQNDSYKLYDIERKYPTSGTFVKIQQGKEDGPAIPDSALTPAELQLKQSFQQVLDSYH